VGVALVDEPDGHRPLADGCGGAAAVGRLVLPETEWLAHPELASTNATSST
jgi:hypothetical protein